jgi:hypothetical protein
VGRNRVVAVTALSIPRLDPEQFIELCFREIVVEEPEIVGGQANCGMKWELYV